MRSSIEALELDNLLISILDVEAALRFLESGTLSTAPLIFYCANYFGIKEFVAVNHLSQYVQQHGKLVAIGSGSSTNQVLKLIRHGVSDYLDVQRDLDNELAELIERFERQDSAITKRGRVYTFLNTECNTDISLLAANVATAIAKQQDDVGLLDFQFQGGFQAQLLNASPRYTLHSIADKTQQLDAKMFELLLVEMQSGLQLLASPESFANGQLYEYSEELIDRVMQFARTKFAHITIDLGKYDYGTHSRIFAQSDRVIVCLQPNILSLYRTIKSLDYLAQQNYPKSRIAIVTFNSDQANALPFSKLNEVLGQPVTHLLPCDSGNQNKSINLGEPLVHCAPQSKLSRLIEGFAADLLSDQPAEAQLHSSVFVPFISAARRLLQLF